MAVRVGQDAGAGRLDPGLHALEVERGEVLGSPGVERDHQRRHDVAVRDRREGDLLVVGDVGHADGVDVADDALGGPAAGRVLGQGVVEDRDDLRGVLVEANVGAGEELLETVEGLLGLVGLGGDGSELGLRDEQRHAVVPFELVSLREVVNHSQ